MKSNLETLRQAVAVSPENVPLLLLLGQACLEELQLDEARSLFERVLTLDPSNAGAKLSLAKVLHLLGRTSEAIVRTEALVAEHQTEAGGWLLLSRLYLGEGQRDQAARHYGRAMEIDGKLADPALESELFPAGSPKPTPERAETRAKVSLSGETWRADDDDDDDDEDDDEDDDDDMSDEAQDSTLGEMERPSTHFGDVGGMDGLKDEIRMKIIHPLNHADLFRAYGKKLGGGVLLYGPPGCGKTLISRATAGEINACFFSIGLHQILDLYLGESEKNLHGLFEQARSHAPSILFFDEVDAIAADRNDLKRSAGRTLINQFLAEMDGTLGNNEGVLLLGATNAPWHIDPAFRRPGRFDRILFVPPPDESARAAIIEVLARDKPVAQLDAKALARKTKDFSGADLKHMFDLCIEECLSAAMKTGKVTPLSTDLLARIAKQITPSTRAWFETAKNYALYSNQSGFYDDVLKYMGIKK